VARESFEPVDLFHAHIGGMDAFARASRSRRKIKKDGVFERFIKERYASYDAGIGTTIEAGTATFQDLSAEFDYGYPVSYAY
jgi:xylose isomerase